MRFALRHTLPFLLLSLLIACGDKSCQYHQGVESLSLSANPASISKVGENSHSLITAIGTGQDNLPMADGTLVTFVSDVGSFDSGSQATMSGGVARITFYSGGSDATARIFARTGSTVSSTIQVAIGLPAVGSVHITANPGTIPRSGGKVTLTANVLSKDLQPLSGVDVIFTSDNGQLASGGSPRTTDANGQAHDVLRLLQNASGNEIQVTIGVAVGSLTDTATVLQQK